MSREESILKIQAERNEKKQLPRPLNRARVR
jgi:hypothetical protein